MLKRAAFIAAAALGLASFAAPIAILADSLSSSPGVTPEQVQTIATGAAASSAPVQTVNEMKGAVTIPTVQRQVSAALDATSGTVSWTFPNAFVNMPTCWPTLAQTDATVVFAAPATVAISKTSVSVTVRAAKQLVSLLSLGTITIWTNPPAGSTLTLSCVAALP